MQAAEREGRALVIFGTDQLQRREQAYDLLARGAREAVAQDGPLGAFTGGASAAAGGITAALFFGFLIALVGRSKPK